MALALLPMLCSAQLRIVDEFEGSSRFEWDEVVDKKNFSVLVLDGYLEIKHLSGEEGFIYCPTKLPISTAYDCKITANLRFPKLDKESRFGMVIDIDGKTLDQYAFLMEAGLFTACLFNDGKALEKPRFTRTTKFKYGKDITVEVVLERKGSKWVFSYDNIEIFEWPIKEFNAPFFAFVTETDMRVEKIVVEQPYTGEQEY